jgi:rod shape-determining protein MreD
MRRSILGAVVFAVLVLQAAVAGKIEILGVRPDAVMIVVVYMSLAYGAAAGAILGFGIGLAEFAIMATGAASLPLAGTVVGFLVGRYGTKIMYESYLVQLLMLFGAVVVSDVINLVWLAPDQLAWSLVRWSVPAAAYTAIVGVALVVIIERALGLRLVG